MPPPFRRLTIDEFEALVRAIRLKRRITEVHMHHTYRPNHKQFRGHDSIEAMYRYHTETNGWSDLAQHVTIDPEGHVWLGRGWESPPASAKGFNGNEAAGPFMFETVGDFDTGQDPFGGAQRESAVRVIAAVQERFGLSAEALRFHNQMSGKSCPGSAIDRNEIVAAVAAHRSSAQPRSVGTGDDGGAFPPEADEISALVFELKSAWNAEAARSGQDPADAELSEGEFPSEAEGARGGGAEGSRGLSPEVLESLRPYVINLNQGGFSGEGIYQTSQQDVDAIFEEHLPRALERDPNTKIVVFAHGGLVKESVGLQIALNHVQWWRDNGVYPLYFVWETGLFETLKGLLSRRAATRDIFDYTTDPVIEEIARAAGGPLIWGGMKRSAELASAQWGGAHYVAEGLAAFAADRAKDGKPPVEVHAIGHSAGSIFHAHFLPALLGLNHPPIASAHFLAPAIRTDLYKQNLMPLVGKDVRDLTIYTMRKDVEAADNCVGLYRKSLLYLIYFALEPERRCPILGLEISLKEDAALKAQFGLGSVPTSDARVVFSKSAATDGPSASRATAHGGFDEDAATMNSVALRVLGRSRKAQLPRAYPERARAMSDLVSDELDLPEWVKLFLMGPLRPPVASPPPATSTAPPRVFPGGGAGGGARRAVCVGINAYPGRDALGGCVSDARNWGEFLASQRFDVDTLLDGQATREAILQTLQSRVAAARPGDVLAFMFAGHGTEVRDLDGDEVGGTNGQKDEAFCPVDFRQGRLLVDDDINAVFSQVQEGVNLTCFFDTCHSDTIVRVAVGMPGDAPTGPDERKRFVIADPDLEERHRTFRQGMGGTRATFGRRRPAVLFSACMAEEVALEHGGQGDFTKAALGVLRAGIGGVSHEEFHRRVVQAFGPRPRQNPRLDCVDEWKPLPLLQPFGGLGTAGGARGGGGCAEAASLLRRAAAMLEGGG